MFSHYLGLYTTASLTSIPASQFPNLNTRGHLAGCQMQWSTDRYAVFVTLSFAMDDWVDLQRHRSETPESQGAQ